MTNICCVLSQICICLLVHVYVCVLGHMCQAEICREDEIKLEKLLI